MSKKLRITKITLETSGGKSIELSMPEARELYSQLHEFFGKDPVVLPSPIVIKEYPWRPCGPYWTTPQWIYDEGTTDPYRVTCNSQSGLSMTVSGQEYRDPGQ